MRILYGEITYVYGRAYMMIVLRLVIIKLYYIDNYMLSYIYIVRKAKRARQPVSSRIGITTCLSLVVWWNQAKKKNQVEQNRVKVGNELLVKNKHSRLYKKAIWQQVFITGTKKCMQQYMQNIKYYNISSITPVTSS